MLEKYSSRSDSKFIPHLTQMSVTAKLTLLAAIPHLTQRLNSKIWPENARGERKSTGNR